MTVGERIKSAREQHKPPIEVKDLARLAGLAPSTIYDLERGDSKGSTKLHRIAEALGVRASWLETGTGPMRPGAGEAEGDLDGAEFAFATRVKGLTLSAGSGSYVLVTDEVDRSHAFRKDWLARNGLQIRNCKLISVKGESMSPYLQSGDVVLVNTADRAIKSGEVYAIAVDDELRVKRLVKRADGILEIRSDNPSPQYPVETLDSRKIDQLNVIGKVVWRGG